MQHTRTLALEVDDPDCRLPDAIEQRTVERREDEDGYLFLKYDAARGGKIIAAGQATDIIFREMDSCNRVIIVYTDDELNDKFELWEMQETEESFVKRVKAVFGLWSVDRRLVDEYVYDDYSDRGEVFSDRDQPPRKFFEDHYSFKLEYFNYRGNFTGGEGEAIGYE